jgi:OOP family OmpA-OmpF porin
MNKLIFAVLAAVAAMGSAQAQTGRFYLGAGLASVDHTTNLPGTTNGTSDGWNTSGKVFGGYDFNNMWGVEAGYTNYAKSDYSYNIGSQNVRARSDGESYYLAGKISAPVNEQFSVYGKLGVADNKVSLHNDPFFHGDSKTDWYGGLGGQYNVNKNTSLFLEYERYGSSPDVGQKADVITVGAKYAF